MPRTSSPTLQTFKALRITTLCFLTKIGPLPGGAFVCLTSRGRDVIYDDGSGDGPLTYYARTGSEHSAFVSNNDLTVDNGEVNTLKEIPTYPNTGITQEMIDAKALDGVDYVVYQVNYKDLTMGHEIQGSGPVGEVHQHRGGLITFELRSWTQYLLQNSVVELDSLTCRVKRFGSQPGDELYPCMKDISSYWIHDVPVTSVGAETVREFTASSLAQAQDYFAPGLWVWTTGANAGTSQEIEEFDAGGAVTLRFTTRFPIQVGDEGSIRRDCTRKWSGPNSCNDHGNRPWFRGEPFIPVSDVIALSVPLAAA